MIIEYQAISKHRRTARRSLNKRDEVHSGDTQLCAVTQVIAYFGRIGGAYEQRD
jgi:hypothetical protein